MIGSLVFCFPVGLILAWTSNWRQGSKAAVTITVAALVGLVAMTGQGTGSIVETADSGPTMVPPSAEPLVGSTVVPPTARPTTTNPPTTTATTSTTAPPTTVDPDIMCKTALADPNLGAPYNACTAEDYDRLQPTVAPGRGPRRPVCETRNLGIACEGIPTTLPPTTAPVTRAPTTRATVPTAPDSPVARSYPNCDALNGAYPHGVGRRGAVDQTSGAAPVTTFLVDDALYAANTARDRDEDGVACERK